MSSTGSGCPHFDSLECRSCTLLPLPYATQLTEKEYRLKTLFKEAGLSGILVAPIVGSAGPSDAPAGFRTRCKTKMAVGGTTQRPVFGFPKPDLTIQEIGTCPLYPEPLPTLLEAIRRGIQAFGLTPFSIAENVGELKHVIIRISETTGEAMVRVVLRSRAELSQATALLEALWQSYPFLTLRSINLQPQRTSLIEGPEEILISKNSSVREQYNNLTLFFSPKSFSQVTSSVASHLYACAANIIAQDRPSSLLDLYCGVGAFSLSCAPYAMRVVGVELTPEAIENAQRAAIYNQHANCSFVQADALAFLREGNERFETAIVNPPRRGLGVDVVKALLPRVARKILYSSCNPESLLADLALIAPEFTAISAAPFDMFPHTAHLEVLVVLERRPSPNQA